MSVDFESTTGVYATAVRCLHFVLKCALYIQSRAELLVALRKESTLAVVQFHDIKIVT